MENVKPLKPVQLSAIRLLAAGTPACHVAQQLHVSPVTVSRWQQSPAFKAKLNEITSSGLQEVGKQINRTALVAVEVLHQLLGDMTQPTNVQIKVALGILNSMPSINAAIDKALLHRAADFDPEQRWSSQGCTYNQHGEPCDPSGGSITV